MPNRLFQGLVNQMRDTMDRDLGVVDESGTVIACSELGQIGEIRKGVVSAGVFAGLQTCVDGCTYKAFGNSVHPEYAVFVDNTDDLSKHYADIISIAFNQIKQTNDEKFDRSNFVKNVILDNILPGDIYIKSRELHFNNDATRVVFIIRVPQKTDVSVFDVITKSTPEKSLVVSLKKNAGRNNQGKITVRHQGGGNRRKYRLIDFKRNKKDGIPATVIGIEYDPNRTANIALICYADGEKSYILAPAGLTDGMKVMSGAQAEVRVGNCLPLENIPVGTQIHNIELLPGKGGQLVRSAGLSAQLMAKEGKYATLRLPSGEMRMVPIQCRATIGVIGNGDHNLVNIGKAGRKRHMGVRPTVRGSVMNPNDHPHGGGEGKAPVGRPGPCTPWGKPALGLKTRKKNKQSNKMIVRRRDGRAIK